MTTAQEEKPEAIHVFPVNDLLEHETEDDGECWCDPIIEGDVVLHNAFDGRE